MTDVMFLLLLKKLFSSSFGVDEIHFQRYTYEKILFYSRINFIFKIDKKLKLNYSESTIRNVDTHNIRVFRPNLRSVVRLK